MTIRSSIMCLFQKNLSSTCLKQRHFLQQYSEILLAKTPTLLTTTAHTCSAFTAFEYNSSIQSMLLETFTSFSWTESSNRAKSSVTVDCATWGCDESSFDQQFFHYVCSSWCRTLTFRQSGKSVFSHALCLCTEFVRS